MINQNQEFCSYQLKTFVVENQTNEKTIIFSDTIAINSSDSQFHIENILSQKLGNLSILKIKTYDFSRDQYIEVSCNEDKISLNNQTNSSNELILLKYQVEIESTVSITSYLRKEEIKKTHFEETGKKQRSKERIIYQVIQIIKRWRDLHQSKNDSKKLSLLEASQIIGLPKKSLDDYYYQLRLGEKYGFDFKVHRYDRFGVLRTFLKNINKKFDKGTKHPKRLKILDEFESFEGSERHIVYSDARETKMMPAHKQHRSERISEEVNDNYNNDEAEEIQSQRCDEIASQFYEEFNFNLNQRDPFFFLESQFKKKPYEEDDSNNFDDNLFF